MAQPIYPCLWFENQAKDAAMFYCDIFPNSRILNESPVVVNFELDRKHFMALNDRRPPHLFNESISFVIPCEDQQEIDYYWDRLTRNGGEESMCGWCTDRFGVSWQVVPTVLAELMSQPDRAQRVVAAFLKMRKFDIEKLMNA